MNPLEHGIVHGDLRFLVDVAPEFLSRFESQTLASHMTTLLDRRTDEISLAFRGTA